MLDTQEKTCAYCGDPGYAAEMVWCRTEDCGLQHAHIECEFSETGEIENIHKCEWCGTIHLINLYGMDYDQCPCCGLRVQHVL